MAVNETFARQIRSEMGDPLQARFLVLGNVRQVVAVVADVKHRSLDREVGREVYIPMGQSPGFFQAYDLIVRAAMPAALVPAIREAIWHVDRDQALGVPIPLDEYVSRTIRPRVLLTSTVGVFAVIGLLLSAFGVYGVVGYRVAQRMKEIAIRVALGSSRFSVVAVVLADVMTYVGCGLAAGVVLALSGGASIQRYLFGVTSHDVVTLAVACTLVVVVSCVAAYLPVRRILRVDPVMALKTE
jgi:ABC-type antimicrobial peptide transport system permease subunit